LIILSKINLLLLVVNYTTVNIWKPDIQILESFKNLTYLCLVFKYSFTILFLVRFSEQKGNFFFPYSLKSLKNRIGFQMPSKPFDYWKTGHIFLIFKWHSKTRQFGFRKQIDHSKSRLVRLSDGHWLIVTLKSVLNSHPNSHRENTHFFS
jgi:hypothetical protein